MTIDEDILIAYATGALTPEEEREVTNYLQQNPEAAARVQDYFATLAAFALSQEPEAVPDNAEDELLARIREQSAGSSGKKVEPTVLVMPKARRRTWWAGLAAAAVVFALLWVGVFQPQVRTWQAERQLQEICTQPGADCHTLRDEQGEVIGTLARRPDDSLFVVLDQPPPRPQVYQAWEIVDGSPRSLGVWSERFIAIDKPLEAGSAFGVTVEPPGGSDQPTSAPIVVVSLSS